MVVEYVKPFGPVIGKYDLPKGLIKDYIEAIEKGGLPDYSGKLIGRLEKEVQIPKELITKYMDFYKSCVVDYVNVTKKITPSKMYITARWFNTMKPGDYNPIHNHLLCDLSCIGLLQVPSTWKDRDHPKDGGIQFIHGTEFDGWSTYIIDVDPPVGSFFLFSYNLLHLVHPFRVEGKRLSFSINFGVDIKYSDTKFSPATNPLSLKSDVIIEEKVDVKQENLKRTHGNITPLDKFI